jgi:deoxyribonuclease V
MRSVSFKKQTPHQAVELQKRMRDRVVVEPLRIGRLRWVAGADLSYDISEINSAGLRARRNSDVVYAGIVVMTFPELQVVEQRVVSVRVKFPYIPGLLSFRESPPILEAWETLTVKPDVLLVDGHGRAHPRRFGIACHLGLLLNTPTVGVGKSILVGEYRPQDLRMRRGSSVPLKEGSETIGLALRTREGVNPVFVSIGHRTNLTSAKKLVLQCASRYRLPEPIRLAHNLVNAARRGRISLSDNPGLSASSI